MSQSSQKSHPHESAHLHVSGEAVYVDDIAEVNGTLYAALGLSERPHALIKSMDLSSVEAAEDVVAVLTAKDIPGDNECGPIVQDDPILADGLVQFVGQPIFVVVAKNYMAARRASVLAKVEYEDLPAIMTPQEAKLQGSFVVPPMQLVRGEPVKKLKDSPLRTKGTFYVGGQEQFYLEGQISYAIPKEDNGMLVYCSTQHPTEMQHLVAHSTKRDFNQVLIETRRMGGGFGGKESQSGLFACVAAVCADHLKCPVKIRLDRDDDFMATGKRHCFYYEYDVGFDEDGRILAAKVEMVLRSGFSTDLSPPVATRAVCHFDNAYYLSDVEIHAMCGKTNTQSNTAFRGFGGPQGAIAIENIIDNIARDLGKDALEIRKANFYGNAERNVTPYGQTVEDNVIHELVDELEKTSDYAKRRAEIKAYNETSPILKKGLALTPVKFGISFNVVHFNQAGALVHIYTDGSILVNHGGTEMGQGLNTKVAQVVALVLGVDLSRVRATATDTSKVVNTSATAASSGTDLNGKAAENAAAQIKQRLAEYIAHKWGGDIQDVVFENDTVSLDIHSISFTELVVEAYENRIQLWSDGFYKTPKLNWDKDKLQGRPFFYFAYGAAVSEVIVDTLTGEMKLLRADLLHDAGNPINTAIDIGQVEGAFIQGMGWLTTEDLWWNPKGKLMTHAPSTYKIPAVNDCPDDLRVKLFHNPNHEDTILRSKAVGEPPLLLGFSVFFAIRDAIASVADYKINPPLDAPATPESIMNAISAITYNVDETDTNSGAKS
ncbi:xanthine dehydrogenase molybdopterin binding subunit [Cocleimonas sp. KMM 6892]|uniref:xanthine dehydrogenase molybdopterin binding subunit n=1 Tax=unclassified Cocleimonas TaxID=2639732 RepID=UPI002DB9E121|nr:MULTISPECIES: xanthine dehydrogenase molybdopterin binding subunit [unclassified Cocleimonas]MEB8431735.1 xanthine dehydrogenase molybdopterin binding subunit [Cocleimonas sp. KMM 6892]MEC4715179.1 xanthine dehydrogenase molybdopterin binding subunit [Cocleimonas sp. KMM 6895]MEC4744007.1 xanthine dehydrogenase molybdopterin binding subunit [Cocleimonas sp. KMM 6896]